MSDKTKDEVEFSVPKTDEQGFAMNRDLPVNHRLRAEALVERGETTDPDGEITDELIASTAERLAAERVEAERLAKEADKRPAVSADMTPAALRRIAKAEKVPVTDEDAPDALVAKIEAARSAAN